MLPHRACKKCGAYAERSVKPTGMNEVEKVLEKKVTKAKKPKAAEAKETESPKE